MSSRDAAVTEVAKAVLQYAPASKRAAPEQDGVDITGQTIVGLLNQLAETTDANTRHALDIAHKLSRQLRIAEERIVDLEADLRHYKERAEHAEKWLNYISTEIKQRFFGSTDRIRA